MKRYLLPILALCLVAVSASAASATFFRGRGSFVGHGLGFNTFGLHGNAFGLNTGFVNAGFIGVPAVAQVQAFGVAPAFASFAQPVGVGVGGCGVGANFGALGVGGCGVSGGGAGVGANFGALGVGGCGVSGGGVSVAPAFSGAAVGGLGVGAFQAQQSFVQPFAVAQPSRCSPSAWRSPSARFGFVHSRAVVVGGPRVVVARRAVVVDASRAFTGRARCRRRRGRAARGGGAPGRGRARQNARRPLPWAAAISGPSARAEASRVGPDQAPPPASARPKFLRTSDKMDPLTQIVQALTQAAAARAGRCCGPGQRDERRPARAHRPRRAPVGSPEAVKRSAHGARGAGPCAHGNGHSRAVPRSGPGAATALPRAGPRRRTRPRSWARSRWARSASLRADSEKRRASPVLEHFAKHVQHLTTLAWFCAWYGTALFGSFVGAIWLDVYLAEHGLRTISERTLARGREPAVDGIRGRLHRLPAVRDPGRTPLRPLPAGPAS